MDTPLWGQYERLRPPQIDVIRASTPVAYVPWGALEWHSSHNPIGLDGMQAHAQCCALAEKTGGVVLPALYLGTDTIKPFKGFPHCIEIDQRLVTLLATNIFRQLADEHFKLIVTITGHMGKGQTDALAEAEAEFLQETSDASLWVTTSFECIKDIYPYNHAARGETAHQLAIDASLVRLDALPAGELTLDEHGIWGEDPRNASAEEGVRMLDLFVAIASKKIITLLKKRTQSE